MTATPDRVRVCFTASELHSVGGVPEFVRRCAAGLRARGHAVAILAGAPPEGVQSIHEMTEVRGLNKGFSLAGAISLARAMLAQPAGTVFVGNSLNAALVTAVTARLSGRRSLFFVHGLTSRYQRGAMFLACRAAEWVTAAFSDAVIVLNRDDDRTLWTARRRLPFAHGVEIPPFAARGGPPTPVRLLCIARHEPQKNLGAVLDALAGGQRRWRLTIIGEGSLLAKHQAQAASLEIADRVIFTPRLTPEALPWFEHDIFLLGSLSEGMPLSLLEAFARGMPAIVTNAPGLADFVDHGQTGQILRRLDAASVDKALDAITQDYVRYSRAARETAEQRFSLADSLSRLSALLGAAGRRPA